MNVTKVVKTVLKEQKPGLTELMQGVFKEIVSDCKFLKELQKFAHVKLELQHEEAAAGRAQSANSFFMP